MSLKKSEIAVLRAVERGMRRCEWVPLQDLTRMARLPARTVDYSLKRLTGRKLIFKTWDPYEGYQIGFLAYDLVALAELVERDVVLSLGDELGVGKESVVYNALGADDRPLAIKFHREGRTSFKHVRRVREHLTDVPRCSWIHAARLGARKEFNVLKTLYPDVSVPEPLAISRHAIAMELLDGVELYRVDLVNPEDCLEMILEEVEIAWKRGLVHADLSPYNVIVVDEEIKIIDWPQAVNRGHPEVRELLRRDVKNVVDHFRRKYRLDVSSEGALAQVTGKDRVENEIDAVMVVGNEVEKEGEKRNEAEMNVAAAEFGPGTEPEIETR